MASAFNGTLRSSDISVPGAFDISHSLGVIGRGRTARTETSTRSRPGSFELGLVSRQTRRIRGRSKKKRLHLSLNPGCVMPCGLPVARPVVRKSGPSASPATSAAATLFVEIRFELGNALAALLVQPYPAAPPLAEVVAHVHLQHGADTRKRIDHDAEPMSARSRKPTSEPHRVRRIDLDDMVDHEPIKEQAATLICKEVQNPSCAPNVRGLSCPSLAG
jgi:hypothetical protein